ncbi:hypothetical protein [Pseudocalidococcus azoricus]|uniref:hypothetical protein n=1 Tax=Pseudocalidococcus azoricus TaxID=3110322 RepID=UPI002AF6C66C|nr:hypothetical protein [Pseudocalidococcus azoricus]
MGLLATKTKLPELTIRYYMAQKTSKCIKKTGRAYKSTPNSYRSNFPCGCKHPKVYEELTPKIPITEPLNYGFKPLKKWCEQNYYSVYQARRLMRKGHLWVLQDKSRYYVKENPFNPIPEQC